MKKAALLLFGTALMMLLPVKAWSQEAYAWLSEDGKTFTFCYDDLKSSREGTTFGLSETWYEETTTVEKVVFNSEFAEVKPTSTKNWFREMEYLTSISGLEYLDTSDVTDMSYMFSGCSGLESIDPNSFDTRAVTNMSSMFANCSKLTSLELWKFDTQNVTNMSNLFSGCSGLTYLFLNSFNTQITTDMSGMFNDCSSLPSLDVSNFITASLHDMENMFRNCSSLTSLDLSKFITTLARNMNGMFSNCEKLGSLDISNFKTTFVEDFREMFSNCRSLTNLDVSHFNMTFGINYTTGMFKNCTLLQTLTIPNIMNGISSKACEGVGTPENPCIIYAPDDFDFGVDTSGDYFEWKSGYFTFDVPKIVISSAGLATYCYDQDLDFSDVTAYKAYVAGGYNSGSGNVTLVRVTDIPANTGIIVKGTPGKYNVPVGESNSLFSNLLIGTTEKTRIYPTEDNNTNFVLSVNNEQVGFYPFTKAFDLEANKAYLQLPNSILDLAANGMGLEFEDETTDLDGVEAEIQPDVVWYTIDGRKLDAKPTQKGLYISNGKKVVVK